MKNYIIIFFLFFGWCHSIFSQSPYTFKRLTMPTVWSVIILSILFKTNKDIYGWPQNPDYVNLTGKILQYTI